MPCLTIRFSTICLLQVLKVCRRCWTLCRSILFYSTTTRILLWLRYATRRIPNPKFYNCTFHSPSTRTLPLRLLDYVLSCRVARRRPTLTTLMGAKYDFFFIPPFDIVDMGLTLTPTSAHPPPPWATFNTATSPHAALEAISPQMWHYEYAGLHAPSLFSTRVCSPASRLGYLTHNTLTVHTLDSQ